MELQLRISMNPSLYLRNPEDSELGRSILRHGVELIEELGFEDFTFRKLAVHAGTTEASVYRYFENKHRLLTYLITWFWTWMEYSLVFHTANLTDARLKIETVLSLLTLSISDSVPLLAFDKDLAHRIVIAEGSKVFLTKHVAEDNHAKLFKPYKDFCARIADLFIEYRPGYAYSHSLASTVVEAAQHQIYFKDFLPSLTDFGKQRAVAPVVQFLHHLVFTSLDSADVAVVKKRAKS